MGGLVEIGGDSGAVRQVSDISRRFGRRLSTGADTWLSRKAVKGENFLRRLHPDPATRQRGEREHSHTLPLIPAKRAARSAGSASRDPEPQDRGVWVPALILAALGWRTTVFSLTSAPDRAGESRYRPLRNAQSRCPRTAHPRSRCRSGCRSRQRPIRGAGAAWMEAPPND